MTDYQTEQAGDAERRRDHYQYTRRAGNGCRGLTPNCGCESGVAVNGVTFRAWLLARGIGHPECDPTESLRASDLLALEREWKASEVPGVR